jgi:transposase-like protein
MAKPGVKSRWNDATRKQVAEMLDRGVSQTDIAQAFNTTQQTISRLAQTIKRDGALAVHDETDPAAFVASFETHLGALVAINRAASRHSGRWNDAAFEAVKHRADRPRDDGQHHD